MDTTQEIKTFRGRSLEELLPQVRSELGPDAIVIRRREGLAGGVAGFFQRSYVELDARPALPDEKPLEVRSDRATAEGLSTPGIQALVEQAAPFADALAAAMPAAAPASGPRLYGPQPNFEAIMAEPAAAARAAAEPAGFAPAPAPEPADPAPAVAPSALAAVAAVMTPAIQPAPLPVIDTVVTPAIESSPVPVVT